MSRFQTPSIKFIFEKRFKLNPVLIPAELCSNNIEAFLNKFGVNEIPPKNPSNYLNLKSKKSCEYPNVKSKFPKSKFKYLLKTK